MRKYWLMNQHGSDGPTALVEIDGRMKIVNIVKFGPDITELEAQQQVWNDVIGRVGPTMKPFVEATKITEEGIDAHDDLHRGAKRGVKPVQRAGRTDTASKGASGAQHTGTASFTRSTGDR